MTACQTCGGQVVIPDFDGPTCLQCSRPMRPVVCTLPYQSRNAEDILQTITRERRFIDAQLAAGQRAWS